MNIIDNELKQTIKIEFDTIIKETMFAILNKYQVSPTVSEKIIKDFLVWSNLIVDMDFN